MFKFLKEKISSWIKKSKEDISRKGEKKKEKAKEPEEPKLVEKAGQKPAKKKRTAKELAEERGVTEEVLEDVKKEGIEIKSPEQQTEELAEEQLAKEAEEEKSIDEKPKTGFFERLRKIFGYKLSREDFEEIFQELESALLENNVALEVVEKIKSELQAQLVGREIKKQDIEKEIRASLKKALEEIIIEPDDILDTIKETKAEGRAPFKIIFFGINGAGKTTTIAKFAHLLSKNGLSCVFAAADTFRAASIEQLQIHADRLGVKMIKHDYESDPAAVAFDAIKYAKSHKLDVVLIDTAGRMYTKENLLQEMEKICRVTKPDLKIFMAESIAGNDATEQAKVFNEAIGIDGAILSKADVDERGGAIISISYATKKPILYLGTGQTYDDITPFDKEKFISQLGLD